MQINSTVSQWADAHVFYNSIIHGTGDWLPSSQDGERTWLKDIIKSSPNGSLYTKNSFFDLLKQGGHIYLAHSTVSLPKIIEEGSIYSSGGCLVGSIYCTPLIKVGDSFRMHNLGKYIHEVEGPGMAGRHVDTMIFDIELPQDAGDNIVGIDYLRLGDIHFMIHKELEYLLSSMERYDLHEIIVMRLRKALDYLSICSCYMDHPGDLNPDNYMQVFIDAQDNLPVLGYLYFEVVTEYLLLFQDNEEAKKYFDVGEFYNPSYKELMYKLHPKLKQNFKLNSFKPSLIDLIQYIKDSRLINKFDEEHFKKYLVERLCMLTMKRFFKDNNKAIDWHKETFTFENLTELARPLLGHLLHRELRTFGRYPSFYFYFDQYKALQIWNYWNQLDLAVPFNGVIPKGEVGINPAYPELKYNVLTAEMSEKDGFGYLKPKQQIEVNIEPKLVDLRHTLMRNKTHLDSEPT